MVFATKARLKILNHEKLRICRRPSIFAWILLGVSVFIFIGIARRLTDNVFTLMASIFGGIMFGLDTLGDWEDFVLDKKENRATFTRCNWSDKLVCWGAAERPTVVMKLSEIRHVGVSINLGLFILQRNGKTTSLSTNGLTREEIQNLRHEVHHFLNLARMEYLDKLPADLNDRLIIPSDSEDEAPGSISQVKCGSAFVQNAENPKPGKEAVSNFVIDSKTE
ncbi:uncharacterized protein LOC112694949 [Athalia rosae]|uniref:uncharacterized protein LOC112694949 n=1 Tax=Athalia rosae TaxID=37344 RepID=UPI002034417A|nr:uncharacterized protein LOC112694949 [Athalia rosae]